MMGRIQCLAVCALLLAWGMFACINSDIVEGTGNLGNQPADGYKEGNEVFTITTNGGMAQVATTAFDAGEIFNVMITSHRVDLSSNGELENSLYLTDYLSNPLGAQVAFFQQDIGDAHIYNQTLQAPMIQDHYLVTAKIEDNSGNIFHVSDVIVVVGGYDPNPKSIETYSDASYTSLDWTFSQLDTIYIEVFCNKTPSSVQSTVSFTDYTGGASTIILNDLSNNLVTIAGNYARFQYNIPNDLDSSEVTGGALNEGYWYGLTIDLKQDNGDLIIRNWTIQIKMVEEVVVEPSLSIQTGATQVEPSVVEREGEHITTLSTQFEDTDEPGIDTFIITFKMRDSDGRTINVVDAKHHNQSGEFGDTLGIKSLGGGVFLATYELDPDASLISGNYDLYFMVEDGTGEAAEDVFQNNFDELQITGQAQPPSFRQGATQCIPDIVDRIGVHPTTISTQFTDRDSVNVTDFNVLFKIKIDVNEIILVDNKTNDQPGEFGGNLLIISSGTGSYTARYTFDPDGSFPIGDYDLFFSVTDNQNNMAQDGYRANQDELEITSSVAEPSVESGSTQVNPNVINRSGNDVTTITARFEDADSNTVMNFTITFKIKDKNGKEYIIVDSAKNGETGEYKETLAITSIGPNSYVATYKFNPPSKMSSGGYSLYFKVEDEHGTYCEDGYVNNENELTILGKEQDGSEDGFNLLWVILPLVILIAIVVILLVLKKGKKEKTAPYIPPPTTYNEIPPHASYENQYQSPPNPPT